MATNNRIVSKSLVGVYIKIVLAKQNATKVIFSLENIDKNERM